MTIVAPSILSADFANLERDCRRALANDDGWLHFDVMDGLFVPNISFGLPVLKSLKQAIPGACYDVHLMIQNPHEYAERFIEAGADILTFHMEAGGPLRETAEQIRRRGARAGVSIKPGTPVEELYPYLPCFDLVLVMSVEPGFGGQAFMPQALTRISRLRNEAERQGLHSLLIEVDGGVNETTGAQCVAAGADILVAGSSVFGALNPKKAVEKMQKFE